MNLLESKKRENKSFKCFWIELIRYSNVKCVKKMIETFFNTICAIWWIINLKFKISYFKFSFRIKQWPNICECLQWHEWMTSTDVFWIFQRVQRPHFVWSHHWSNQMKPTMFGKLLTYVFTDKKNTLYKHNTQEKTETIPPKTSFCRFFFVFFKSWDSIIYYISINKKTSDYRPVRTNCETINLKHSMQRFLVREAKVNLNKLYERTK